MSQFVLDDHLRTVSIRDRIRRWSTAAFLRDLRSGEVIKDERVPLVLQALRTPTFITIDKQFWNRARRHRRYCILYFNPDATEQTAIPDLLRRLVRLPDFRTRAARMGKVARVSREEVRWWQMGDDQRHALPWPSRRRRSDG